MNKVLWIASLGATTLVLASCGNRTANNPPSPTQSVTQAPTAPAFEKPVEPAASAFLPTVPVKGMIQTTNSQARLSQISTTGFCLPQFSFLCRRQLSLRLTQLKLLQSKRLENFQCG